MQDKLRGACQQPLPFCRSMGPSTAFRPPPTSTTSTVLHNLRLRPSLRRSGTGARRGTRAPRAASSCPPRRAAGRRRARRRSEEHTSELQSPCNLVCRLLLEKKKIKHEKCDDDEHMLIESDTL